MHNDHDLSDGEALVWENEHSTAPVPFLECSRHVPYVLRLSGRLDVAALSASVDALFARHAMLRAVYGDRGGRRTMPAARGVLRSVDLRDHTIGSRVAHAERLVDDEVNAPIDLSTGPVARALLVRLDARQHIFAFTAHHIVLDGWSRRVLARDLHRLYGAAIGAAPPPIAPTAAYDDYVALRRTAMDGGDAARHEEFWRRRLTGVADARVPSDAGAHRRELEPIAGRESFTVAPDAAAALRSIGRGCGATLAVVTLAVFAQLIHELTGEDAVTLGVPIADRPHSRFEPVIGLMMNALTIPSCVSHAPRFDAFVGEIARTFADVYEHRALPFRSVVDLVRRERGPAAVPFRALLNVVKGQPSGATLPGVDSAAVAVPVPSRSAADLSLHVLDTSAGLECLLVYQRERFGTSASSVCRQFQRLVRGVLAAPDGALSRLCCEPGLPA